MALIDDYKSECTLLYQIVVNDGEGGYAKTWIEGATFTAAFAFDNSLEARVADAQGVHSLYTVTIDKEFMLNYHNVFRREKDGKIFRVTSDGDDKFTPQSSSLDMRQVSAEEFVPTGELNE